MIKIDRGLRGRTASAFGYVIFGNTVVVNSVDSESTRFDEASNGPIKSVSAPSILMAQYDDGLGLALSISSPALNLQREEHAPSWCPAASGWPSRPVKNGDVGEEYEFCAASEAVTVLVRLIHGRFVMRQSYYVDGKAKSYAVNNGDFSVSGDTIEFTLRNGFTTEIRLND